MDEYLRKNAVVLCGTVRCEPAYSHENHGERFYRFQLAVSRLSGQEDLLWILAKEEHLEGLLPLAGRQIRVDGFLRSFNNKSGQGSRLVISVLARQIQPEAGCDCNQVELTGVICKPPAVRRTPLGRRICDVMLAVNRRYGRADYLPCIAWGQVALELGMLDVGDTISLEGRLQSRQYTKMLENGSEIRTAFEVSIMRMVPVIQ